MKLLLDTHIALWWFIDSPRLKTPERLAIGEANEVYISIASAWEMAIKRAKGKLRAPSDVGGAAFSTGCTMLPITLAHVAGVAELPARHGDPFDRLLISQAQLERLTLITYDKALNDYDVPILGS